MVKFSNEYILPYKLTDIQEQVFTGGMLGDAALEFAKTSKFPRMKIDRQYLDKEYLEWQFNIFRNLCTETAFKEIERYDARYNKINKQVSFRTRAIPAFKSLHEKWYPNGKKIIPKDIKLTPIVCAIWFADDGSIIRTGEKQLTLKMATDGFGYEGASFLSKKLEKMFNSKFQIYKKQKDKDLWFIKTSTKSAFNFIDYIDPVFNIGMDRKRKKWADLVSTQNNIKLIGPTISIKSNLIDKIIYEAFLANSELDINTIQIYLKNCNLQYTNQAIWEKLNKFVEDGFLSKNKYADKKYGNMFPRNIFLITDSGRKYFDQD